MYWGSVSKLVAPGGLLVKVWKKYQRAVIWEQQQDYWLSYHGCMRAAYGPRSSICISHHRLSHVTPQSAFNRYTSREQNCFLLIEVAYWSQDQIS